MQNLWLWDSIHVLEAACLPLLALCVALVSCLINLYTSYKQIDFLLRFGSVYIFLTVLFVVGKMSVVVRTAVEFRSMVLEREQLYGSVLPRVHSVPLCYLWLSGV